MKTFALHILSPDRTFYDGECESLVLPIVDGKYGIIVSTGIVSNFATTAHDYYYNSSLAHCVYYGATLVPASGRNHLHGEIVSFGVLTLLTYDKNFARRDELLAFNASVGLPVTLAQIELTEKDLQTVAATVLEWRCSLQTFTKEAFMQAMRDADAAGKKYLANH